MNTKELCRQVYEVLKDPKQRCVGFSAKDAEGRAVEGNSPDACRWCLSGAVAKVVGRSSVGIEVFDQSLFSALHEVLQSNTTWLCDFWDRATDEGRQAIVDKLKKASEE